MSVLTFLAGIWGTPVTSTTTVRATTKGLRSTAAPMGNVVAPALHVKPMIVQRKANRVTVCLVCSRFPDWYQGMSQAYPSSRDIEYCSAGFCSSGLDASPTPNAKRQLVQPGQVRQQLCAAGMVACPVQPKGYEVSSCFRPYEAIRPVLTWFLSRCINTWADLESCGGCPGSLKEDGTPLGVDCTALPNVDVVSCMEGSCAIGESLK
jgi:hypothetical protein